MMMDMIQYWPELSVAGILTFTLGVACGVRLVHCFQHVTTKALHQTMLTCLHERTATLDLLTRRLTPCRQEGQHIAMGRGSTHLGTRSESFAVAEPRWPRLWAGEDDGLSIGHFYASRSTGE